MQIHSQLPVASLFFKHWHTNDTEIGVIIAKAKFRRHENGKFRAGPMPEIAMEDVFEADPAWSPLVQEQDLAPGKVGTDLTIRAVARSAENTPRGDWAVSVSIPDRLHYGFQVRGPSMWTQRRFRGWQRDRPELVTEVPITYALAYGGRGPGPDDTEVTHEFNPAGLGLVTAPMLTAKDDIPVPQIGALGEFMAGDPVEEMNVHGLTPIAKAWLPRRSHAGTFDKTWERDRHPRMPTDYSLRFWNAAPGPLQLNPALQGNERITLEGISARPEPVEVVLPGVGLAAQMVGQEATTQALVLDTVALDLRSEDPQTHEMTLTWRALVRAPQTYEMAEIVSQELEA